MATVSPSPEDGDFSNNKQRLAIDMPTIEEETPEPSPVMAVASINAHKIIAELVGTYVIILIGCGCVIVGRENVYAMYGIGKAVTWGLVVMVMIYTLGHVSGGHFNPAITIAFVVSYKFPWRQMVGYVGSQLTGSILAVLTLNALFKEDKHNAKVIITDFRQLRTAPFVAFLWEFILSFILMLSICGVATDTRAVTELSGVAVGATVIFSMVIAGDITGASMNPARSLGPALVTGKFDGIWVYMTAPILGMIAASSCYSCLWLQKLPKDDDSDSKIV